MAVTLIVTSILALDPLCRGQHRSSGSRFADCGLPLHDGSIMLCRGRAEALQYAVGRSA
jgi:hypothetical protein